MDEAPTTRLDLMAASTAADPQPEIRELRQMGSVVWHEGYRRWFVTTDREIRDVLADFKTYTLEGTTSSELFGEQAFISIDDRKRHDALRLVWADAFRRPALERMRPQVQALADGLLDPMVERLRAGEVVEAVGAVCRPLPTLVICLMMGVPQDRLADVVRWSDAMAGGGPAYLSDTQSARRAVEAREAAKAALAGYLGALLVQRRAQPGEDLVSMLARSEVGQGLPDADLVQNLRQLLFAGNETTAKWLAHLLVVYGQDRALQGRLAADRSLVAAANDEVMRWQGVVGTVVRKVRGGSVTLAGVDLREGDGVTCLLASANRDPARYRDPETCDVDRPPQPNLAFGVGLHHCLGISLAKLEAEVLVNGLMDRIGGFRLEGTCQYSALPLRGPQAVRIALD